MKALSGQQAAQCETAKTTRCRCRCGGLLHGSGRFTDPGQAQDLDPGDPHRPGPPPDDQEVTVMDDAALIVAGALGNQTRGRIRRRWDAINPHQAGAPVADILHMLDQADSDLDIIESIPPAEWPASPLTGIAARALLWGRPWGALRLIVPSELEALCAGAGWLT